MSVTKRPGESRWRARFYDDQGKEHSRRFDRKADGERWVRESKAALDRGQFIDPKAGKVTVRDYAESWRQAASHRPTTRAHVETMLRRHVYPAFGDRALASVRPSEVQAWVTGLPLAPSTVGVVHGLLAGVYTAALRDRLVTSSPCEHTRLPKVVKQRIVPLTDDQVRALVAVVPDPYRALVLLAAGTGLRQGEAVGLTVDRIDFLRARLTVDQQLVTVAGREPYLAPPKTAASQRTVPLPQVVVEALARHLEAYPTDGLVFTDDQGRPIRRSWFSAHVWRPAVAAAGLPDGTGFHDLRHYYASTLIHHGASVKVVQDRLGHASASETLDTYSHIWPDSDEDTRSAIDAALGGGVDLGSTATVGKHPRRSRA